MIVSFMSRVFTGALGVFSIAVAIEYFVNTYNTAEEFGLTIENASGYAQIRSDIVAYFAVIGILTLLAAFYNNRHMLIAPLALMVLSMAGRLFTFATLGASSGTYHPMIVEGGMLIFTAMMWFFLEKPSHKYLEMGGDRAMFDLGIPWLEFWKPKP